METNKRIKEQDEFLKPYIDRMVAFYIKPRWQSTMSGKIYAMVRVNKTNMIWMHAYYLEVLNGKKGNLMPIDIDRRTLRVLDQHEEVIKKLELETLDVCGIPRKFFTFDTTP